VTAHWLRPYDTPVRRVVQRVALCACVSALLVWDSSAARTQTVTLTVFGKGRALWKLDAANETSRLRLTYHWHGTLSFVAPSLRKLSTSTATKLVASWNGTYRDKRGSAVTTCTYAARRVRAVVVAKLANGRTPNTLELTFHPRRTRGFFRDKGGRAIVRCSPADAQNAPAHFAPSWFFRDGLQDHGRLASHTAIIVLPRGLLPQGRTTVAFPSEAGRNDSPAVGRLAWSNRGETSVRTR
jgi:hypothetical protein